MATTYITRFIRLLGASLFGTVCLVAAQAQESDRIALVIGNSAYKSSPLVNPRNDANAMADLLSKAGFRVDKQLDTDLPQLQAAVNRFGKNISDPKIKFGLFYYAGHGLQQDWRNYLVPVSATIKNSAEVPKQTVDLSHLLNYMDQARGRSFLVILDACRDDPFADAYKPPAKGLSQFDAPVGSLLAYATSPGNVAQDGTGENGLYTGFLLREFAVPGTRLEDAFKRVRVSVRLASKGTQIPWESTSLEEDLYLFPSRSRSALSESEKDQLLEKEMASWLRVKSSADPEVLAGFIREYPSGSASELAQSRLSRLLASVAQQAATKAAAALAARQQAEQLQAAQVEAHRVSELRLAAEKAARLAEQELARIALAEQSAAKLANAQAEAQRLKTLQTEKIAAEAALARLAEQARLAQVQAVGAAQQEIARLAAEKQRLAVVAAAAVPLETQAVLTPTPFFKGSAELLRKYALGDEFNIRVIDQFTKTAKPLVLKVTEVDTQADRVIYNQGEFVSDLMGNITTNQRGLLNTPRQFYPADLFIGKKWKTRFKQTRPGGIAYTFQYDLKVVGVERITVPAGSFDAFRIEASGFNMELGAALERTIWVAPGVAADIAHEIRVRLRNGQVQQNDRQELVSMVLARP